MDDVDWDNALDSQNVNESWSFIKEKIEFVQHNFVPNRVINKSKNKSYNVTKDDTLHYLLRDKRAMFKLYKKYPTKINLLNYTQARNKVSYKIKLLKQDKENKKDDEEASKEGEANGQDKKQHK